MESYSTDEVAAKQCKALKNEALQLIKKLLQLSKVETVRLIEDRFGTTGHKDLISSEALRRDTQEQLSYLETLLEEYDTQIQETIRAYGMGDTTPTLTA